MRDDDYEILSQEITALRKYIDTMLEIIREHSQRYSRGSVTRVALDNLALEISERLGIFASE